MAGFCFGAKRYDRVKSAYVFTLTTSTIILSIFAAVFFNYASYLVKIFQRDVDVVKIGTDAIRFFAMSLPLLPLSVITNMLFQASGKNKEGMFLSSCRQGIFFIPLVFILPRIFGLTGLELCQPIANTLSALISIPFLIGYFKQKKE